MEKTSRNSMSKDSFEIRSISKDSYFSVEEGATSQFTDGKIRCIPMPTADPKDPLNLPAWRVGIAILAMCLFGAFALATEAIIGSLAPIFSLYYAGIDPHVISTFDISGAPDDGKVDPNPAAFLDGLGGPPLSQVLLLTTLPLLTNGLSNYFLVPFAVAIGRRPILLLSAACALTGGIWAGLSRSLQSHIIARCFQGIGAGSVEAVIPLVIQDIVFIHQRAKAIGMVWAFQGIVIVTLGIGAPHIVQSFDWRTLYFVLAAPTLIALVLLIVFVPESRWRRTSEELAGKSLIPLEPGQIRPALNYALHGKRSFSYDLRLFDGITEWGAAAESLVNSVRSFFFPTVFYMILINSMFLAITNGLSQLGAPVFLAKGFNFTTVGFAIVPLAIACPFVWIVSGWGGDKVTLWLTKRNGGQREPEFHLVNLILPMMASVAGCLMFGAAGSNLKLPLWILLTGLGLVGFATLSSISITSVYVVESYPEWAGPVLTNVSSFRSIFGFAVANQTSTLAEQRGYFGAFAIFAGALAVLGLLLPVFYAFGRSMRLFTYRFVKPQ